MTQAQLLEEAITTLFCQIDDRYRILNPRGSLRVPQEALGLGGPRSGALPATAGGGIRTLLIARGRTDRVGDRVGEQRSHKQATQRKAASRDRLFELEASFWSRRNVGEDHYWTASRIAAKIAAYTYAFYVNRMMGRPQGRIKELWS